MEPPRHLEQFELQLEAGCAELEPDPADSEILGVDRVASLESLLGMDPKLQLFFLLELSVLAVELLLYYLDQLDSVLELPSKVPSSRSDLYSVVRLVPVAGPGLELELQLEPDGVAVEPDSAGSENESAELVV